jgi:hypothetical protein
MSLGNLNPGPSENAWQAFTKIEPVLSRKLNELPSNEDLRRIGYYTFEEEANPLTTEQEHCRSDLSFLMSRGYLNSAR